MKLFAIETVDVRGLQNGIFSFAKGPEQAHDRVLVTGGPGTGKTRLLQVIAAARKCLAPYDDLGSQEEYIRRGNRFSKAILAWLLSPEEQARIGSPTRVVATEVIFGAEAPVEGVDARFLYLIERYSHDDDTPKLEYFSEQRRLEYGGGEMGLSEGEQAPYRASDDPRKFAWLPTFLAQLPTMPDDAARFAAILERVCPTAGYDLQRKALCSRGRPVRSLAELSASEADGVTFAATATLVGLSHSIVLVDRPEVNGLDPQRALAGLSALGADNQLFIATSSPDLAVGFDGAVIQLDQTRGLR
ncbi:MAG: hypothetical protein JNK04_04410 [Myxococcales bacterium]|nr:hypothetical protein [Myxococcales bacterium]